LERVARELAGRAQSPAVLAVLEDDPEPNDAASANYRECLQLLAEVDPNRGALLDRAACERALAASWPKSLAAGRLLNQEAVRDPHAPLQWLRAQSPKTQALQARLARLQRAVQSDGMAYGHYWYTVRQCA
jgi:hypothetical protein